MISIMGVTQNLSKRIMGIKSLKKRRFLNLSLYKSLKKYKKWILKNYPIITKKDIFAKDFILNEKR